MTEAVTVEVACLPIEGTKRHEFVVRVGGEIVHREGGASQVDYCHASGFAAGVRCALGLDRSRPGAP